jgi:hypothetical protein
MAKNRKSTFDLMMAWEEGELSNKETTELFQRLIDNGQAWTLQGMYGRQAQALIDAGYCHYPKKKIANKTNTTDYYGNRVPTHEEHKKRLKDKLKHESRAWS